mgnify:CR=1 FL=1
MAQLNDAQTELEILKNTVKNLVNTVNHLSIDVTGLMASQDRGVYGEYYANDSGPAVRVKFFEGQGNLHDARLKHIQSAVTSLESTFVLLTTTQTDYHDSVERLISNFNRLEDETNDALSKGVPSIYSGPPRAKTNGASRE